MIGESGLENIKKSIPYFAKAKSILFITGAGISAESGLPTYRGIGGLYNDKETDDGIPIEEALSGSMMRKNPGVTWKYLYQIEESARGAKFNRAHQVMAEFEKTGRRVWTLTQNVDSFHSDAGSKNLIEIHGNFRTLYCTKCSHISEHVDYRNLRIPPRCPECNSILRPNVVLFGEMLPEDQIGLLQRELSRGFDLIVSVGTTSVFPYIAGPVWQARSRGVPTIEINPGESEVSHVVTLKISAPAGETLDIIWKELEADGRLYLD